MSSHPPRSLAEIRDRFPQLRDDSQFTMFENAGGSFAPDDTINEMINMMRGDWVQLGAGYPASERATQTVKLAHKVADVFVGGGEGGMDGYSILGSSTTLLLNTLSSCLQGVIGAGDEIIVVRGSHEANVGCWERLAESTGASLVWWGPGTSPASMSPLEKLPGLLTPTTRVLAMSHSSNLLGEVVDVAAASALAKDANPACLVVVDGVAFAPHRAVDVGALGVDFYVWSTYKAYGPHAAAMFGRRESWQLCRGHGPNHHLVPFEDGAYYFEPGNVPHELCAGIVGSHRYLRWLSGREPGSAQDWEGDHLERQAVVEAMTRCEELEAPLTVRLLEYLESKEGITPLGLSLADSAGGGRLPLVGFTHATMSAATVVAHCHAARVAVRNGHMYSKRLLDEVGPLSTPPVSNSPDQGLCRLSLVHYNSLEEIEAWIAAMEKVL